MEIFIDVWCLYLCYQTETVQSPLDSQWRVGWGVVVSDLRSDDMSDTLTAQVVSVVGVVVTKEPEREVRGVTVLYFAAVLQSQASRQPAPSLLRSGTFQIFCKHHILHYTPSARFTNTFVKLYLLSHICTCRKIVYWKYKLLYCDARKISAASQWKFYSFSLSLSLWSY